MDFLSQLSHMHSHMHTHTHTHSHTHTHTLHYTALHAHYDHTLKHYGYISHHYDNDNTSHDLPYSYEVTGCEVVWAIRDDSISSTFFDAGAATFFLPHLEQQQSALPSVVGGGETKMPLKRLKYMLDPIGNHYRICMVCNKVVGFVVIIVLIVICKTKTEIIDIIVIAG